MSQVQPQHTNKFTVQSVTYILAVAFRFTGIRALLRDLGARPFGPPVTGQLSGNNLLGLLLEQGSQRTQNFFNSLEKLFLVGIACLDLLPDILREHAVAVRNVVGECPISASG